MKIVESMCLTCMFGKMELLVTISQLLMSVLVRESQEEKLHIVSKKWICTKPLLY